MSIVNRVLELPVDTPRPRGPYRVYAIVKSLPEEGEPDDRVVLQTIEADWFDATEFPVNEAPEIRSFIGARFFVIKIGRKTWERFQRDNPSPDAAKSDAWWKIRFESPRKWSTYPADARVYEDSEKPAWNLRMVAIAPPDAATLRKLGSVFRLPERWKTDPQTELKRFEGMADPFVVAYDVGQGSANGIHAPQGGVVAYFDFGGGATTHAKTFPRDLRFCFSQKPLIVLSHWHEDHWISASKHDMRALESDWIVPDQDIGPADLALALAIQSKGGKVVVVPPGSGLMNSGPIIIGCCSGSSLNESGLAMLVRTARGDVLLPGDCGYEHLPDFWAAATTPPKLIGLTAPHHGGLTTKLKTKSTPQPADGQSKLAYSFGQPNRYGHSRGDVEAAHVTAGWTARMTKKTPTLRKRQGHVLLTPIPSTGVPCLTACSNIDCSLHPNQ